MSGSDPDRGSNGRFLSGNRGGPGRPPRRVEEAYLDAMRGIVTMPRWRKIVRQALEDALAGNHRARVWLSRYVLPSPAALEAIAARRAAEPDDEIARLTPREVAERILALPIMYTEPEDAAG